MQKCASPALALIPATAPGIGIQDASADVRLIGTTGFGSTPSELVEVEAATGDIVAMIGPVGYTISGLWVPARPSRRPGAASRSSSASSA